MKTVRRFAGLLALVAGGIAAWWSLGAGTGGRVSAAAHQVANANPSTSEPPPRVFGAAVDNPPGADSATLAQDRSSTVDRRTESLSAMETPTDEQLAITTVRYGEVLRSLPLSAATGELLTRLLAERALLVRNVLKNAHMPEDASEPGESAPSELLAAAALKPLNNAIEQLAGEAGFNALVGCDENLRVQRTLAELQRDLERAGAPLREDRMEAMSLILTSTAPKGPDGVVVPGVITTAAVSRSWGILNQRQVEAFEQLQKNQGKRRLAK